MNTATMTVRLGDLPNLPDLLKVLLAEHAALNAYLVAGLLHKQTGHHWSDLLVAHDNVANRLASPTTPAATEETPE